MRILITSGGGAKGAFSVGALDYLNTVLPGKFDFISGTSTGSMIAAMMACDKLFTLINVYSSTENQQILKPTDILDASQKGQPYIYDTQPLMKQLNTYLDKDAYDKIMQSPVILCFNSVCLQTGKITVFSTKTISASPSYDLIPIDSIDLMRLGMMGSSNQAAFMNPVEINGKQYVDGGNREVIPTRVVVENIPTDEAHDVYVLSNNPTELLQHDGMYTNILEVLFRAITMFIQEVRENDMETLVSFKLGAHKPMRIFYIHPEKELDTQFPTGLNFNKFRMRGWMEEGRVAAKKVITDFPNGNMGLVV
jgi:predicted acylesterase/phospholipase RssA